jgi:hypothetical protein
MFPRSRSTPRWPLTMDKMDELAASMLTAMGGWDRVLRCVT